MAGEQPPASPAPYDVLVNALRDERPAVRAVLLRRGKWPGGTFAVFPWDAEPVGSLPPGLWEEAGAEAERLLSGGVAGARSHTLQGEEVEMFYDLELPPPTMVIIGGVHIGIELARQAKLLGYRVIVVDPRRAFGTTERFPMADAISHEWPEQALARSD